MLIDLDDGYIDILGITKTTVGGEDIYTPETAQSHIRIDAKSPYFKITSAEDVDLIHIGSDNYYLQSNNYEEGKAGSGESAEEAIGAGMKINLKNGRIDAYNLKITSQNIILDSASESTYFKIKDDAGKTLMNVGKSSYYLQSSNYDATKGTGVKIDLDSGSISADSFQIKAEGLTLDSDGTFYIGDGTEYISFSSAGLSIAASSFKLQTSNIYVGNTATTVTIGDSDYSCVFRAGNGFGVSASGELFATSGLFTGAIKAAAGSNIGGWTVNSNNLESTGGMTLYDTGQIYHSDNFEVTADGILHAQGAEINGSGTFKGAIYAESGIIGKCEINADGYLRVDEASIKDLNVTVLNTSELTINGEKITGTLSGHNCAITDLNASNLTDGTVPIERL
jgi:hypothetical protein